MTDHDAIIARAREHYAATFADGVGSFTNSPGSSLVGGACLYWAASAIAAAREHGVRLVLQAGGAAFRRLPAALDDGKPDTLTHFAYEWTPPDRDPLRSPTHTPHGSMHETPTPSYLTTRRDPQGHSRLCLPEMHVWCGDIARQHVVDLSTFDLVNQCQRVLGQPWLCPLPAPFVWGDPRLAANDGGWHYEPNRDATLLAARVLIESGVTL